MDPVNQGMGDFTVPATAAAPSILCQSINTFWARVHLHPFFLVLIDLIEQLKQACH